MRIVGEISHPTLKVTIMHHNEKYTVQFEDGDIAQSIIIRESQRIDSVEKVQKLIDKAFLEEINESIKKNRKLVQDRLQIKSSDQDFEVII